MSPFSRSVVLLLKPSLALLFIIALSINFLSIYYLINLPKINYVGYEFDVFTISI